MISQLEDDTLTDEDRSLIVKKLKELTELYLVVKEIIIYFEEINPEQKSDIQPINELRNAFDHLMRCFSKWLGIDKNQEHTPSAYILTHLSKSFGHVYRAGYDTVDFLSLTIKGMIVKDLQDFSMNTITTVLPEYFSVIKSDITSLNEDITKFRANKDVANVNGDHLIAYIKRIKGIVEHHKRITKAIPELNNVEKKFLRERKKNEIYDWKKRITISFIIPFIIFVVGWSIGHFHIMEDISNPSIFSVQQEEIVHQHK